MIQSLEILTPKKHLNSLLRCLLHYAMRKALISHGKAYLL